MNLPLHLLLWLLLWIGAPASAAGRGADEVRREQTVVPVHAHHEAIIGNARDTLRLCHSRPQRLLPSGVRGSWHTPSPSFHPRQYKSSKIRLLGSRRHKSTAPILPDAHGDYYVLALRHLLC